MVGTTIEELQCCIVLTENNLQAIESNLALAKSCQEDKMNATTKACNQMRDRNNQLLESQQWLETLLLELDNPTCESKEKLQHKIEAKKGVLKVFQGLVDARVLAYELFWKESKVTWNVLYALEGRRVIVFQQNDNVVWSLLNTIQKGLVNYACIRLPCVLVENNEPRCVWVEHCPFFGLGFQPLWVGPIASCKHVYHN